MTISLPFADAYVAIAVILVLLVLFAFEVFPVGLTCLMGAFVMAFLGIIDYSTVFSSLGKDALWMMVGMMIVSDTLFKTGVAPTLGKKLFSSPKLTEKKMIALLIVVAAGMSAFVSNIAVVTMFMPILAAAAAASNGRITIKNTYMVLCFAACGGGALTLVGSTPQLIAQGILVDNGLEPLKVFTLFPAAFPGIVIMFIYFLTIGGKMQNKVFDFEDNQELLESAGSQADTVYDKKKMIMASLIMIFAVASFTFSLFSAGSTAMICAILCVATRCNNMKSAFESVDWNTIMCVGGAMGFASGVDVSGAGKLIADTTIDLLGGPAASPFLLFVAVTFVSALLTQLMTNIGVVAMMCPIAFTIATSAGVNPMPFLLGIINGANISYVTPVAVASNATVLVAGYRFADYVKIGGPLAVLCLISQFIFIPMFFPF